MDLFVMIEDYRLLSPDEQWSIQKICKELQSEDKTDQEILTICKQEAQRIRNIARVAKMKTESKLGRRFTNRTFETYKPACQNTKKGKETAFKYANNFLKYKEEGRGLIFTGNNTVGTGKTHLASAIANYIMDNHILPVKFGTIINLLDEYKSKFGSNDDDFISYLSKIELLILDDLGKEKLTDWAKGVIYQIVNNRYEAYMPIVATTELPFDQLENFYGKAIPSRLFEMCISVNMQGKDYRLLGEL